MSSANSYITFVFVSQRFALMTDSNKIQNTK